MNDIILYILMLFMSLGALDRILGYKLGLGQKFEEGFMAMGNLALSIIGIYSIAPLLSTTLEKVVGPIFSLLGADPSIFPASILASDMGGYLSAMKMAESQEIGLFAGLILASSLGAAVIFTIPIGAGLVQKVDYPYFTKGVLIGLTTVPISGFVGGISMGLPIGILLKNLLPIVFIAFFLGIGLIKWPENMITGFYWFSKSIITLGTLGLVISVIQNVTGKVIIVGMEPFDEGLRIVGSIAIILSGAYPMVIVMTNIFKKPLSRIGNILGISEKSITALIMSLANNIPAFANLHDMDDRGKVMVSAFSVGGAFVLGGQLGFVAGIDKTMITPFIISKIVGGIGSIVIAYMITKPNSKNISNTDEEKMLELVIADESL